MAFENLLNPVLNPLLGLPSLVSIILISFVLSLMIVVIYKFTTDQDLMKRLKTEMKEFQKEIKELKGHPEKAMEVQKKSMATNSKYMMHSMKPTLFTFLPIIIIFGWLNAHMAYLPLEPGNEFTASVVFKDGTYGNITIDVPEGIELMSNPTNIITNSHTNWVLKGVTKGEYLLEFTYNDEKFDKEVLITDEPGQYKPVLKGIKHDRIKSIEIGNKKSKPLNLFGWQIGWIGTYIIFSIIFSMLLRKLMKVY